MFQSFINDNASDDVPSDEVVDEDEGVTVREDDFDVQDDEEEEVEEEEEGESAAMPLQQTQESARAFLPTSDPYNSRRG